MDTWTHGHMGSSSSSLPAAGCSFSYAPPYPAPATALPPRIICVLKSRLIYLLLQIPYPSCLDPSPQPLQFQIQSRLPLPDLRKTKKKISSASALNTPHWPETRPGAGPRSRTVAYLTPKASHFQ